MECYYIHRRISRAAKFGTELSNAGTTEQDYIDRKWVKITKKQADFYAQNPTASFSEIRNNLNSATINNLLLGQTNNQPLNNLTVCVTLNIIQWESIYAIFFKSGNIETTIVNPSISHALNWDAGVDLKYVITWSNGMAKYYFNGVLVWTQNIGNANGVTALANIGGANSAGQFYIWNMQMYSRYSQNKK